MVNVEKLRARVKFDRPNARWHIIYDFRTWCDEQAKTLKTKVYISNVWVESELEKK